MSKLLPEHKTPYDPVVVMELHRPTQGLSRQGLADITPATNEASACVERAVIDTNAEAFDPWIPKAVEGPGEAWSAPWAIDYRWLCAGVVYAARRFIAAKWEFEDQVADALELFADEVHETPRWEWERERFRCVYMLWDKYGDLMQQCEAIGQPLSLADTVNAALAVSESLAKLRDTSPDESA